MEYICTKEETIKTGINILTVKLSKWKLHKTLRDSLSIHLNRFIDTVILFKPTSKKAIIASNVVIIIDKHVINCAPLTPTFLPKNPETIAPNKGKVIMAKNIISIEISIKIIFFLFRTKPKIPIKKSIRDKFIVYFIYFILKTIVLIIIIVLLIINYFFCYKLAY